MFSELCEYNEGQRTPPLGINLRCIFKMRRSEPLKECWKHMEEITCKGPEAGESSHMWAKESRLMWLSVMCGRGRAVRLIRDAVNGYTTGAFGLRDAVWSLFILSMADVFGGHFPWASLLPCVTNPTHFIRCLFLALWLFYINMYKS